MEQKVKEEFLELQRTIRKDRVYQMLIREDELIGRKLSGQMASMTREQQDAVTDYCGVLIELQWKVLEHALSLEDKSRSQD